MKSFRVRLHSLRRCGPWSRAGARFGADLEAGKPAVRLEHVLRVLPALGVNCRSMACPLRARVPDMLRQIDGWLIAAHPGTPVCTRNQADGRLGFSCRPFFAGLLPEGEKRRLVVQEPSKRLTPVDSVRRRRLPAPPSVPAGHARWPTGATRAI